jgi:hypothetical protein
MAKERGRREREGKGQGREYGFIAKSGRLQYVHVMFGFFSSYTRSYELSSLSLSLLFAFAFHCVLCQLALEIEISQSSPLVFGWPRPEGQPLQS